MSDSNQHSTGAANGSTTAKDPNSVKLRQVGVLWELGAGTLQIALGVSGGDEKLTTDTPDIGDYLLVECGEHAGIVCQVEMVRLIVASDPLTAGAPNVAGRRTQPVASVRVVATYDFNTGQVVDGMPKPPHVGARVCEIDFKLVKLVNDSRQRTKSKAANINLEIAVLNDENKTPFIVTPETLFGRHLAVLGTSGGGKSWSLARIVEETAKFRSKVILFDASGEYSGMKESVLHVHLGHHPNPGVSREVVLPYYQLKESDLFAIFQPSGQAQGPKLRAAIKSLKLVLLAPGLAVDGTISKANKSKIPYEQEYLKHIAALEKPDCNFDMGNLIKQIQHECVNPFRSPVEPYVWGDVNTYEHSSCTPLINRISDMTNSAELAPIFQPKGKPSIVDIIEKFLQSDTRVLCVNLQYLSFAHGAREILANAMGRYLLDIARHERFREHPLVVILDEAHQFLNSSLENVKRELSMDAFGLIAKEGRKYSLSICIATQRPRDIPESVLSQMGTFIVHRLINDKDLSIIERASGAADSFTLGTLPTLASGHAIVLGADFPTPIQIKMRAPQVPPFSYGPNYQKYWS